MTPEQLADLAVECGAATMVSPFTHPKGPRTAIQFKIDESLSRFAAASTFDALALLRCIKQNLMHARRFAPGTLADWRSACVQAEGDIEEFLNTVEARPADAFADARSRLHR